MTSGDEPTNNVHNLPSRPTGDDATTPTQFSISASIRAGSVPHTAPAASGAIVEPVSETEAKAGQLDLGTGVADDDEVRWADGTSTDAAVKRRGLRKPNVEAAPFTIGDESVPFSGPSSLATNDNDVLDAAQPPAGETDGGFAPPHTRGAVGAGSSRPTGDDWGASPAPVRGQPGRRTRRGDGGRSGRGRYLTPIGLLIVGLVAALVIVAALTSHGHAPTPKAFAKTEHKTHAPGSHVVTVTVPVTVTNTTALKRSARPKPKHKAKPPRRDQPVSHSTATPSTVTSTPLVSSPPAATSPRTTATTPPATHSPKVTSPPKTTTTSSSPRTSTAAPMSTTSPKTSTTPKTHLSSASNSSSSTSGGLPDLQQTEQQP